MTKIKNYKNLKFDLHFTIDYTLYDSVCDK